MMTENRFDRNERLFGKKGQARLRKTRIAVMGAGGLGSHVIAQCALLGVGGIVAVDRQDVALSDRNRYMGVWHTDPIPRLAEGGARKAPHRAYRPWDCGHAG